MSGFWIPGEGYAHPHTASADEQARRRVAAGSLPPERERSPYHVPRPVKAPVVPSEFVPPANGRPVDKAVAFLLHELASGPVKVNALMAKAAGFGISESTLRRAKKRLSLKALRREDEWLWTIGAAGDSP
jgi:hypothetical protein